MDSESLKYPYKIGPHYRKFLVGDDMVVEVNADAKGALMMYVSYLGGNNSEPSSLSFPSESLFLEFSTKLLGFDALQDWESLWQSHA
jgi:hypothetical protein